MNTKACKFRLYPTPAQETTLRQTLETCRGVYNSFLLWRIVSWETQQKSVGCNEQTKALPLWKKTHPELKGVFSQVLQNVGARVDLAFAAFFRRVQAGQTPGFPRFKGEGYDSFTYPQLGFSVVEGGVNLSKIGRVKAVLHRQIDGKIKTCTVRRQAGKWFACFAVEVEPEPLPQSADGVGIDVGLEKFAVLSNGERIENPRFWQQEEKALAKAQRKLAKQKKGSRERRRAKKVIARVQERARNRRHDFVHQTAHKLVNRFGVLAIEKLNVKNMSRRPKPVEDEQTGEFLPNGAAAKSGLNKSIGDVAWSLFRAVLTQKAESAGRLLIAVNPAYTSQDCPGCGKRVKKKLSARWHDCNVCGLSLDRDHAAAQSILKTAMGQHSLAVATA